MSSESDTSSNTEQYKYHVRFQVLIAENLKITAFWDIEPSGLIKVN
jgi:hypothetical protein